MQLRELAGKKIGICVSGGLDSKAVTTRLLQEGLDVVCFTADLAQVIEQKTCGMRTTRVSALPQNRYPSSLPSCHYWLPVLWCPSLAW